MTGVDRSKGNRPGVVPASRGSAPEQLSEPPVDVPVAEADCPRCGGELAAGRVEEASITDLPEVVRPRVRLFRVAVRRCRRCGGTVWGRHPDLAPDQRGATAHHLHFGLGVPVLKLPEIVRLLTGATLTQGATYRDVCESVREAPYVHTDDTGWRVGGSPAWMMAFETDAATVY